MKLLIELMPGDKIRSKQTGESLTIVEAKEVGPNMEITVEDESGKLHKAIDFKLCGVKTL